MNEKYFTIYQLGMTAQLAELDIDEMVLYVRNHIHSFLLCESVCFCFVVRLLNDKDLPTHEQAKKTLFYLLDKAVQFRPFRMGLLQIIAKRTGNPQVANRLKSMEEHNKDSDTYQLISGLDLKKDGEDAKKFIAQLLQVHPTHIAAAQFALSVDRFFGTPAGPWVEGFQCPLELKRDWLIALFDHHAAICDYDKARELWPTLDKRRIRETTLNFAAEMFVADGDIEQALALYDLSLKQDPRQTPVRLRVKELHNPFVPDSSLLEKTSVSICLYSFNKAAILEQTLKSLSESDIGPAHIHILLNGCKDNSREVVDNALALFPDNPVIIHDLHVNIGAPAARNWLQCLPEVQQSKYIAFLDDDVTIQKNWLAAFLTVAETDETIGVVGCKIVNPGEPSKIQYLFRYVAMAHHGLLKMSIDSPQGVFDNHLYDFTREARSVMGCQHLLRTSALKNITAGFDIRFSPSQVDDIDHDLAICLEGYKIMYCGQVACIHHQLTGAINKKVVFNAAATGNTMGNDIKLFFKHYDHLDKLAKLDNLSLQLGVPTPEI